MADVTDTLTKPVGGVPLIVWLGLGGVGVYVALRASQGEQQRAGTTVEQVPVPVGAVAAPDGAPLVMSPVVRINVPEIDKLTGAIVDNTSALGSNTGALGQNTSATVGNTNALGANTAATGSLTGAIGGLTNATSALTQRIGSIPATTTGAPAASAPAAAARTYVVKSGDTLSGIAQRYTGNASRWPELYRANAATIDSVARSRGKAGGGHWIFPGTTLTLPW